MLYDEQYWNNKWKKEVVIYEGRNLYSNSEKQSCDVRIFITHNEQILDYVLDNNNLRKQTFNDTQLQIQDFVTKNIKYKSDDSNNKSPEFWQFPFETIQSGLGDCEDGQILIQSLLIRQGVPQYRVKVQQGYVLPGPTQPQGGHAYCIFLEDPIGDTQEYRILDWCFYPDNSIPVSRKPLAKNGGVQNQYKEVWFTFNSEYSWTNTSLQISGRVENKEQVKPIDKKILFESIINKKNIFSKVSKPNLIR